MFGQSVKRNEDPRVLTGRGRYVDDFEHSAAQVAFVRSEPAHARIVDIDVAGTLDIDGVLGIYTYEDLEDDFAKPLPLLIPNDGLFEPRTQYALAREEVCYAGEVIAMVVAKDRYIAEDAASAIRVEYETLPVVADLEGAARPGSAVAHSDMDNNVNGRVSEAKGLSLIHISEPTRLRRISYAVFCLKKKKTKKKKKATQNNKKKKKKTQRNQA